MVLQQQFSVPFQFPVYFTEGLFQLTNASFETFLSTKSPEGQARVFFVIDDQVVHHHPGLIGEIATYFHYHADRMRLIGEPLLVSGGEASKNDPKLVEAILEATHVQGIDRHSYIAAIGGGAVLDMVGFAAAIAHRGIRHIRIPTTVLSQNDSGVGVKNSFNYFNKKNYLGTFVPPVAVFNDFAFLTTLNDRDWRGGISEAVKVALIKDYAFFTFLEEHAEAMARREMPPMKEQVIWCAKLHMAHIAGGDPFELGSSRPLDFGHWAAHKMEQLTDYTLRHGEAVAIGIALDTVYSYLTQRLEKEAMQRVLNLFSTLGFALYHPVLEQEGKNGEWAILQGLQEFKEHLGGKLTIMLLRGLGKGEEVHEIDPETVKKAVGWLKNVPVAH